MELNTRGRTELKSYFVKNAIPTESNFADFIDAVLNLKDDGIVKPPGNPLSIEASGDDASQKKAINFYRSFADDKPSWVINLNPRSDPNKPDSARPGFNISDGDGKNRLFIERSSGNVGVGTLSPEDQLDVVGNLRIMTDLNPIRFTSKWSAFPDSTTNQAEISNDTDRYKTLMIVGNKSAGGSRRVSVWDKLEVNGEMFTRDGVNVGNRNTHLETDGSFYRYRGQVYITVDDNLYIRDMNSSIKFHFDTNAGIIHQENWKSLPRASNWVNYGGGYNSAEYFKDKMGIVHLRGLIKKGTGAHMGTLPADCSPLRRELHVVSTNPNAAGRVDILADGRVWGIAYNSVWTSLDGITFRAK